MTGKQGRRTASAAPVQYLPATDPVMALPLRFLTRFDLALQVEMGLE